MDKKRVKLLKKFIKEGEFYFALFLGTYAIIGGAAIKFIDNYFLKVSLILIMYITIVIITYSYAKRRIEDKEELRSLEK